MSETAKIARFPLSAQGTEQQLSPLDPTAQVQRMQVRKGGLPPLTSRYIQHRGNLQRERG
jgi:hypothetical protein